MFNNQLFFQWNNQLYRDLNGLSFNCLVSNMHNRNTFYFITNPIIRHSRLGKVETIKMRSGKDVPQSYSLRHDVSSVTTPEMKLVGFTKIELKPGESRRLTITIPNGELALWTRQMKRVVEPGSFTLMVGSSAETIALRGGFQAVAAVGNSP